MSNTKLNFIDNRPDAILFRSVDLGEAFIFESKIFIRIKPFIQTMKDILDSNDISRTRNALLVGWINNPVVYCDDFYHFGNEEEVIPVHCTINIKYNE